MAGDEGEAKHGAPDQAAAPAVAGGPGPVNPLHAEWTASDARAPLEAATIVPHAPVLHDSDFVAQGAIPPEAASSAAALGETVLDEPAAPETAVHETAVHETAVHETTVHETIPHETSPHEAASHEPAAGAPSSGDAVMTEALIAGSLPPENEPHVTESPEAGPAADSIAPGAALPPGQATPARPRRSAMPIAASIIVGAIIGAGSAYYVDHVLPGGGAGQTDVAALKTRIDKLEKATPAAGTQASLDPASLKETLAALTSKAAAAESAAKSAAASATEAVRATGGGAKSPDAAQSTSAAPGAKPDAAASGIPLAALQASIAALEAQMHLSASAADVKAAQDKLAAIEAGIAGLAKDQTAVQGRVTGLQSQTAALQSQSAKTEGLVTALQTDTGILRSAEKSLEAKFTNAPAYAVIADSLVQQIGRGAPFVTQVNALDSLGIDPAQLSPLRASAAQGVATVKVLADKFDALSAGLVAAAHKLPPNATFWDRLKDGAGSLVSVHRDGDTSGTGLAAQIATIKASLAHGDVAGALAAWNLLPADAISRPEAIAWGNLAKAHAEASAAARAIENEAMASLGVKKS